MSGTNESYWIVEDYFNKKMLCKLGYRFDPSELDIWQLDAYRVIENTFNELQSRDLKRKK